MIIISIKEKRGQKKHTRTLRFTGWQFIPPVWEACSLGEVPECRWWRGSVSSGSSSGIGIPVGLGSHGSRLAVWWSSLRWPAKAVLGYMQRSLLRWSSRKAFGHIQGQEKGHKASLRAHSWLHSPSVSPNLQSSKGQEDLRCGFQDQADLLVN